MPDRPKKVIIVNVRMTAHDSEQLKHIADIMGLDSSKVVRLAIKDFLEKAKKQGLSGDDR